MGVRNVKLRKFGIFPDISLVRARMTAKLRKYRLGTVSTEKLEYLTSYVAVFVDDTDVKGSYTEGVYFLSVSY